MARFAYVYILSDKNRSKYYTGVTSNLRYRLEQHRRGTGSQYTSRYRLYDLVYFEKYEFIQDAIRQEKRIKNWHREWKINYILRANPELRDLTDNLTLID